MWQGKQFFFQIFFGGGGGITMTIMDETLLDGKWSCTNYKSHFNSHMFQQLQIKHKHLISSVDWWHIYMYKSSYA